jgi:DNA-binding NtrC family response regulator
MGYGLCSETMENKAVARTVVVASADADFRTRLSRELTAMRWQVREAGGGAEAVAQLEREAAEAMVLDSVLPDLEVGEFAQEMRSRHPVMDLLRVDAGADEAGARSPRRNELLHALREALADAYTGGAGEASVWTHVPVAPVKIAAVKTAVKISTAGRLAPRGERGLAALEVAELVQSGQGVAKSLEQAESGEEECGPAMRPRLAQLPEMVGESAGMQELARMVRLVAPRSATVLILGDTGTGKELVAKAVHRLSARANKPFQVLNCAAIPEALLEAELFGHTRGAFTGAVQSRTGRIEAAHGGTLFLDEIGEMPLALQAKMLRFLESGELQRVGDNEVLRVDVRVVAASHQPLAKRAKEGTFRLDLYHRLAVFPVVVPALRDRMEDLLPLAEYLLARLGEEMPMKRLSEGAAKKLMEHAWPGNVRELAHVLERGTILAEDRREISRQEIRF